MPALTQAVPPSTAVTEIPGRFSPIYVVDKRGMSTSQNVTASMLVTQTAPATSTSGGTGLTATTPYYYLVTALFVQNGVTVESGVMLTQEKTVTTGAGAANSNTVNWTAVTGATGYRIWRGLAPGAEQFLVAVGAVVTYLDTGAVVPTATNLPIIFQNSTTTADAVVQLFRCEAIDATLDTPTTPVIEIGTNYHVNEYDDLPESKLRIQSYDVGVTNLSCLTGKSAPAGAFTSTFNFNDLATAVVDVHRQFADPNGNVFASMFMSDLVFADYGVMLKAKSTAVEEFNLQGFNMLMFRGFTITKQMVVTSADVTNGYLLCSGVFGANEGPVALPIPAGGQPASYWIQKGCYNFLKIERFRPGTGLKRFPETLSAASAGLMKYTTGTKQLAFFTGDLIAGDVVLLSYASYGNSVAAYSTVPQLTGDTSDPAAVSTRLTPFTISANNIARGQSLDLKMTLKRERAEGIGDVDGIWGPPESPEVALSLDVKMTDMTLNSIMETGSPLGTDSGGTVTGDFFDPNYMTRNQIASATPIVVTINDPRNSAVVVKTYTSPTAVFKNYNNTASNKATVTAKYTGIDKVGNLAITVTKA